MGLTRTVIECLIFKSWLELFIAKNESETLPITYHTATSGA